jgi:hypothetical protein
MKFAGPEELWDIQLELLEVQRSIQDGIAELKDSRRDKASHEKLENLRAVRWHARRLGDAFGWIVLGVDKKTIVPLTENSKVPITKDDHGNRGLVSIAGHLAGEGWGFPLLHDVTDCLRIGDLTFVQIVDRDRQSRTVEVKTRLQERVVESGDTTETLEVTVIHPLTPEQGTARSESKEVAVGNAASPTRPRRVDRQLERMRRAHLRQTAPGGA